MFWTSANEPRLPPDDAPIARTGLDWLRSSCVSCAPTTTSSFTIERVSWQIGTLVMRASQAMPMLRDFVSVASDDWLRPLTDVGQFRQGDSLRIATVTNLRFDSTSPANALGRRCVIKSSAPDPKLLVIRGRPTLRRDSRANATTLPAATIVIQTIA